MQTLGTLKAGSTLVFYVDVKDNGVAVSGIASYLKCQVRTRASKLLCELSVREDSSESGRYYFEMPNTYSTSTWTGIVYMDIRYKNGTTTSYTETFLLSIEPGITQ